MYRVFHYLNPDRCQSSFIAAFLFPPRCLTVFQFVPLYSLTLRINLMISDYFVQPSGTVKHQEQLEVYSRERTSPFPDDHKATPTR